MAEKKKTPLGDEEVMTLVNQKVKESVGWFDSRLSRERQRVIDYYNSMLPKRQHKGSSSYISTDVYDSVEAMKAQLLETFSANPDNLVSFPANGTKDVEPSRIATEYCNYVFMRENDGYEICNHAIHDGLTARVGVCKVFWDKSESSSDEEFSGVSYQDVQGLAAQPDISELEATADENAPDPQTAPFSGKLTRTTDTSRVQIDPLPPEEFLIEPRARKIAKAGICAHRTLKTKAELIEDGYDKATVNALHYDDNKGLDLGPEVLARNAQVETSQALDNPIQPELEKVMLYESYVRMDMREGAGVKLYKICHVSDTLLSKEEVDRAPFKAYVPLPVPHIFYGNNFAQRVVPTQNARTVLTRAILDHAVVTTNPRWGVVKGGLTKPSELLDNRLGGIVNLNRPDAVKALEQANLNPYVFQTLEMLKTNKEESTGISSLSQGMNKDAISTQNSAALVDNLVTLSQTRQKIIARNFASFLVEIYLEIYRLVLENQDKEKEKIIEVAGNFVPVKTVDWVERTTCKVALHLGYGERDRELAKHEGIYKSLASDPGLTQMFAPPNRYAMVVDGLKLAGKENYSAYITDPKTLTPPAPDPLKVRELDIREKEADASMIVAQAAALKSERQAEVAGMKEQLAELSLHMKALMADRVEARKEAETEARIDIAERETVLLEAAPVGKTTDVVSPHV
jgi:hypothetical protein